MLLRLLLLFTLVPLLELGVLVQIGQRVGVGPTLLLVLATGVVGAWLARREGTRTWWTVRKRLRAGRLPAEEMLHGLLILVAGAFLVTPGVLTDGAGFALLVRPLRGRLIGRLRGWLRRQVETGGASARFGDDGAWTGWSSRDPGSGVGDSEPEREDRDGDDSPPDRGRVIEI